MNPNMFDVASAKLVLFCSFASGSNVFPLLAQRELLPRTTHSSKKLWRESSKWQLDPFGSRRAVQDARQGLVSWYGLRSFLFFSYIHAHAHAHIHTLFL